MASVERTNGDWKVGIEINFNNSIFKTVELERRDRVVRYASIDIDRSTTIGRDRIIIKARSMVKRKILDFEGSSNPAADLLNKNDINRIGNDKITELGDLGFQSICVPEKKS